MKSEDIHPLSRSTGKKNPHTVDDKGLPTCRACLDLIEGNRLESEAVDAEIERSKQRALLLWKWGLLALVACSSFCCTLTPPVVNRSSSAMVQ
jgi:hypothetical protein